ncbi:MAG: site-specific DNA-methyltransferase [Proteobacteria bacterium]|uniref:Methyltransferase n=1 Tax=Candidatus Avisuccinivibrio stercorigallinarum TaxID=2840704 RepID=A0A9D9DBH2_9GAMM|nr:site-specific DNA-methyltransferase [Candidatus Avisuccinivibrio stercorigallinarum]
MDVFASIDLLKSAGLHADCTMLDPWYNKGVGGELPLEEYDDFIRRLLNETAVISDLMYLWGFPEIIGPYVRFAPEGFYMAAWLTWYYKNCPSVIRGWRSSQNACLKFMRKGHKLHPENFLTAEQKQRFESGKMRFVPGLPSVIEAPLIIGFIGKNERTGHPSQKPEAVFDKLLLMAAKPGDLIFDPMAGSGTTAACALKHGMRSIVCDQNEDYIQMLEKRLGVKRIAL